MKQMLRISERVSVTHAEIQWQAIGAQGAGGQNVNKVASAIHLRFDIAASSLPDIYKQRLLARRDRRITNNGVIVLKAQRFRSREQNLDDALARLKAIIKSATAVHKRRKPTRAPRAAKRKRLDNKTRRGQIKALRGKLDRAMSPLNVDT